MLQLIKTLGNFFDKQKINCGIEHIQNVFQKSIIAIINLLNSRVVNDPNCNKIYGNRENQKKIQKKNYRVI